MRGGIVLTILLGLAVAGCEDPLPAATPHPIAGAVAPKQSRAYSTTGSRLGSSEPERTPDVSTMSGDAYGEGMRTHVQGTAPH